MGYQFATDLCPRCGDYSCPGLSYHNSKRANWVLKEPAAIAPVILTTDEVNNEMESAMDKAITPYRSPDLTKPAPTGPKHGLIRTPKPHNCHAPGYWLLLFYRLCFKRIHIGSLWRCKCGKVFSLVNGAHYLWDNSATGNWADKGGTV